MTPFVYDIACAAIILICIGAGFKRGVLKTVLGLVCTAIAFLTACALSTHEICSAIYDRYFQGRVASELEAVVKKTRQEAADRLTEELMNAVDKFIDESLGGSELLKDKAADIITGGRENAEETIPQLYAFFDIDISALLTNREISAKIDSIAAEYSKTAASEINSRLPFGITVKSESVESFLADNEARELIICELLGVEPQTAGSASLSAYMEKTIVRPIFLRFIGIVIFTAVFAAAGFVLRIAVGVILAVRRVAPIRACDSLLGGALGAVTGAAAVLICTIVIHLLVSSTGGMNCMNEDYFEQTLFFKWIYEFIAN